MSARWPKIAIGTLAALGVAGVSASLALSGAAAAPRYNEFGNNAALYALENDFAYDEANMVDTNMGNFDDPTLYNSMDLMGGDLTNTAFKPYGPWDAVAPK